MGRSGKKSSGDGQSLVTILFVLGVIGWGFFAIDRLTDSDSGTKSPRIQGRASGQESGWKKGMRDWLSRSLNSKEPVSTARAESVSRNVGANEIPLVPDPKGLRVDSGEQRELLTERDPIPDAEDVGRELPVYLYRLNSRGQPVLSQVRRRLANADADLAHRLALVIRGPSAAEADKDYIDSFIRKPRILGASMHDGCAVVDFDTNFGAGVSHQTLKFQIRQLFRNVQAWTKLPCLELTVRGKYQPHLGTDGIYFPRRLDAQWLAENL
ncbi:MAG: hypothetical protein U1F40_05960 [Turneriella sp.]